MTLGLELDRVSFRFGEMWIFRELSLSLPKGSTLVVTGENGVGKSTSTNALVTALRDPEVVERAVDDLPAEAGRIFELLRRHGPQRLPDLGVPFWSPYGHHIRGGAVTTLVERGLAGVDVGDDPEDRQHHDEVEEHGRTPVRLHADRQAVRK